MRKILIPFFKFFPPVILWLCLFARVIWGERGFIHETFGLYAIIKFFFDNLSQGVIPLWNPFLEAGYPTMITLSYAGVISPLWILVLIFNKLGFSLYPSFIYTIVFYFFWGQIGFYCLAKAILKNSWAAYAAFLFLLFSSISLMMAPQYHPTIVYVPGVWFFFFFVRFCQCFEKRYFVGMTFSLMMVVSIYLPFYFLTVFLTIIVLLLVLYPTKLAQYLHELIRFLRHHVFLVILCLACIFIASIPGLCAYQSLSGQEIVSPARGRGESIFQRGSAIQSYESLADSGLGARMSPDELYSSLDDIPYGNEGFIYLSLFVYLLLALGALNKMNKRMLLFLSLGLFLFLLMMVQASVVHRFLFQHIYFFRIFRNLFFLMPYFLSAVILLAAEHFKLFQELKGHVLGSRVFWLTIVLALHIGIGLFLFTQEEIIKTTYLALILSGFFWVILLIGDDKMRKYVLPFLLFFGVTVQPAEVFWHYNQKAFEYDPFVKESIHCPLVKPSFAFIRPDYPGNEKDPEMKYPINARHRIFMTDAPVFDTNGFAAYWTYYLFNDLSRSVFQNYIKHKFLVYDHVKIFEGDLPDFDQKRATFQEMKNVAIVGEVSEQGRQELTSLSLGQAKGADLPVMKISGISEQFHIQHFDVNSIQFETNFKEEKFLVYNDSFNRHWKAFRNGGKVQLLRANIAFKGIHLPPGKNSIFLRFSPPGGMALYVLPLLVNSGFFIYLLYLFFRFFQQQRKRTDV